MRYDVVSDVCERWSVNERKKSPQEVNTSGLEEWRLTFTERGLRISRSKTVTILYDFAEGNYQGIRRQWRWVGIWGFLIHLPEIGCIKE